jgi:hypothetical protein
VSTIDVRVVLSVKVDGDAWGEIYGSGGWPSDLREQVREYVAYNTIESAAANEGAIVGVEIRS